MEERQRVKIVDYTGSKKLDQTKIEEKLKEENILIRLDSFIDPGRFAASKASCAVSWRPRAINTPRFPTSSSRCRAGRNWSI